MVHNMFVKKPIDATNALWKHLGHIPGLNLFVGEYNMTGDFHWKHLLKLARIRPFLLHTVLMYTS